MLKLMKETGMMAPFQALAGRNPVFGTCAGAILMARTVVNPIQEALGLMNLDVERNGYGRQVDSSIARIAFGGEDFEAIFIRAPIILRAGSGATVLAEHNGQPVLVEEGQHLVATFHPELTADTRIHAYFLSKIEA
ncbi:MAG: pyridoxal 5'-phosphate synthase glutaminase subunit PdxT [Bryobacteraceae bacterium]